VVDEQRFRSDLKARPDVLEDGAGAVAGGRGVLDHVRWDRRRLPRPRI